MNNVALDFLKRRDRATTLGINVKEILPIATPFIKKALASDEFKNGYGRIVKKGRELFFEITPPDDPKQTGGSCDQPAEAFPL